MYTDDHSQATERLIVQNFYNFYLTAFSALPSTQYFGRWGLKGFFTGFPFYMFNTIFGLKTISCPLEMVVVQTLDTFRKDNIPTTWLIPSFSPIDYDSLLTDASLILAEELTSMTLNLSNLSYLDIPTSVTVRQINESELEVFMDILEDGFDIDTNRRLALSQIYGQSMRVGTGNIRHFIAFHGMTPVTICSLYLEDQVVGIFNVTTRRDSCYQGFATQMLNCLLRYIDNMNINVATLMATSAAISLYRKLQFRVISSMKIYYDFPG